MGPTRWGRRGAHERWDVHGIRDGGIGARTLHAHDPIAPWSQRSDPAFETFGFDVVAFLAEEISVVVIEIEQDGGAGGIGETETHLAEVGPQHHDHVDRSEIGSRPTAQLQRAAAGKARDVQPRLETRRHDQLAPGLVTEAGHRYDDGARLAAGAQRDLPLSGAVGQAVADTSGTDRRDEQGPHARPMLRNDRRRASDTRRLAHELERRLTEGVYVGWRGPQYETPAEVTTSRIITTLAARPELLA